MLHLILLFDEEKAALKLESTNIDDFINALSRSTILRSKGEEEWILDTSIAPQFTAYPIPRFTLRCKRLEN